MLLRTSQDSLKTVFKYITKFPFAKSVLHRLSEAARGKSVVFFSLHRVIDDQLGESDFIDQSALHVRQIKDIIIKINKTVPFISMREAIEILKGAQPLVRSQAVLILESSYNQSINNLMPILKEARIPVCIMLSTHSIHSGEMVWMDEVVYRLATTSKSDISVKYVDRSFPLTTPAERSVAAAHFVEHLSHCHPEALQVKLTELRETLDDSSLPAPSERIASISQLKELMDNPLVSFGAAGQCHWPFYEIHLNEASKEIVDAKEELSALFDKAFVPVFFYPLGFDKRRNQELLNLMMDCGYEAAISRNTGICHPGDNMFRLMRLPLGQNIKSFEQFELMGLSDAIDEFLLVTLAKDKEY